jgi:arylsulfatase A-like enzyme
MSRPFHSAVPLLFLVVLAACAKEPPPVPSVPAPPPHLLLISLDACRADHLSAYGYGRDTSPFLKELAARGTLFRNAFCNTHGTTPSHATMLSSLYQETHRIEYRAAEGENKQEAVPTRVVLLPELLKAEGYITLGVTDGGQMARAYGFDRGFVEFDDAGGGVEGGSTKLLEMVRRNLPSEAPLFAFLHTYSVHSPYLPPTPYRTMFGEFPHSIEPTSEALFPVANTAWRDLKPGDLDFLRAQYDGGIRFADDTLRRLFDALRAAGFLEQAVVAVTADHGEEFGEHGGLLHRAHLYDELMRIPLILAGPGVPQGQVEEGMAGLVDLAPTLLSRAGIVPRVRVEGRDLLDPAFRGEVLFSQYGNLRYAVRTRQWKYILTTKPEGEELYDLQADPGEKANLAAKEPAKARRYCQALEEWRKARPGLSAPAPKVALTPEHEKQLRALGYIQ